VATQARFAEDLASILDPVPESATAGDPPPFKNYGKASCGPVYLSAVTDTAQAGGELLTFDLPAP